MTINSKNSFVQSAGTPPQIEAIDVVALYDRRTVGGASAPGPHFAGAERRATQDQLRSAIDSARRWDATWTRSKPPSRRTPSRAPPCTAWTSPPRRWRRSRLRARYLARQRRAARPGSDRSRLDTVPARRTGGSGSSLPTGRCVGLGRHPERRHRDPIARRRAAAYRLPQLRFGHHGDRGVGRADTTRDRTRCGPFVVCPRW